MKKCYLLFVAALLTASVAVATDMPTNEAYLGYNFVHFSPNASVLSSFDANGGVAQFAHSFSPWIAAVVDVGGVTQGGLLNTNVDSRLFSFTAGPRATFHKHGRFQPYVQVLFGAARSSSSTSITLLPGGVVWPPPSWIAVPILSQPREAEFESSRTGFAMLAGGGLDIKVGKHFMFRPVEADYFLTRMPTLLTQNDTNRNHFRYSAGVNFLFGAR